MPEGWQPEGSPQGTEPENLWCRGKHRAVSCGANVHAKLNLCLQCAPFGQAVFQRPWRFGGAGRISSCRVLDLRDECRQVCRNIYAALVSGQGGCPHSAFTATGCPKPPAVCRGA